MAFTRGGGCKVALGTGLGKGVNDGVTLILVLGLELLQPGRLPSHCTDEEPRPRPWKGLAGGHGAEPGSPDPRSGALSPLHPLSPSPVRVWASVFSTALGPRPVLETDSRPGVPGARLKFLRWRAARVDVLHPFLQPWPSWPARRRKDQICPPAHCGVPAQELGQQPRVSLACG